MKSGSRTDPPEPMPSTVAERTSQRAPLSLRISLWAGPLRGPFAVVALAETSFSLSEPDTTFRLLPGRSAAAASIGHRRG